ncbi:4'-phosphopantetheinyl transferase family protein [Streptomyces sp. NBC_00385]|uniref:4'-phosphopantetheinyl transferase family protein n=1 Tax=Streptomyces sp. NBC_00385 TaxID=2975733 RepID=UPI002DD9FFC8|nr:4'-phosphopantetheinyl transferase superfamily protein [Streptomyces sp. NBC_00385]WRZ08312.1 4'-phosphopantetheinyl transferase superfamily protein [Streptomyces sp. NBC_00385]
MIAALLPPGAVGAEVYDDPPEARLHPAEEAAIARAVETRRREFTTVRHCARTALSELGRGYEPLVPGHRGAPGWPAGVVGSMTHCSGFRAAAVARSTVLASLGIDAEPDLPLMPGMLASVSLPAERERVAGLMTHRPGVAWDRLLFSAKEAVYKAWFPLTGLLLDFPEAEILIDPGGTFRAVLLVPGPVVGGRAIGVFHGRWAAAGGLLATAIGVPQPARAISRTSAAREFTPNLL